MRFSRVAVLFAVFAVSACTVPGQALPGTPAPPAVTTTTAEAPTTAPPTTTASPSPTTPPAPAPAWVVGAHPLARRADGYGQIEPTPAVLRDRSLPTTDILPPPANGQYASTINAVPAAVQSRSTWQAACPVKLTELRYLTMSFWGFDGKPHTGEMLVNASVAPQVTSVFGKLFAARFPIEEMRVTSPGELNAPPTGDGNNTSAFVCRPVRGQTNWSAHAYGLAIDLDPFCNPYTEGDVVLPELASAYVDRSWRRPGMVLANDATVHDFAAIGWSWGGAWQSPTDRMHFTATGG